MIEQPIAGIAAVREIVQACAEEPVLHPVTANFTPEEAKTEQQRRNYEVIYTSSDCGHLDCVIDYGQVNELPEPMLIGLGLSLHSEEVIKANQKYRKRRRLVKQARLVNKVFNTFEVMYKTFDLLDEIDNIVISKEEIEAEMKREEI
jgi:hypothetical protein